MANQSKKYQWLLYTAISALVLLNVGYWVFRPKGVSQEVSSSQTAISSVVQAGALAGTRAVLVTADNHLILLENSQPIADILIDDIVTTLTVSPDKSKVWLGTSNRQVLIFDDQLKPLGHFNVNGRVTGLYVDPSGKAFIGYGIGQFTGKFYVGLFDGEGTSIFKNKVGIDVNAVSGIGQRLYYAQADGAITGLNQDGTQFWSIKLSRPTLQLRATQKGELLAGDDRGSVSLINSEGAVLWTQTLSEYKISMLEEDPITTNILVGDLDGNVYLLKSSDGSKLFSMALSEGSVRNLIGGSKTGTHLVTSTGGILTVNIGGAMGTNRQSVITWIYITTCLFLVVVCVIITVAMTPKLSAFAGNVGKKIKLSRTAYVLIFPAFIFTVIFVYIPTVMGLYYSFTNFNLAEPVKFTGLENFYRLARDKYFLVGVWNMLLILVTSVLKTLTVPLLVAELIYWLSNSRLKYWVRTMFIVPSIVPGVVGVLLWKMMYNPNYGMFNMFLNAVGLESWTRAWLADEKLAIWAIIFAGFPWISTFAFLIYFGGLLNINQEIFDAAAIDGANFFRRFISIDWPLIRPQVRLLLFFTFIDSIQGYGNIYIFTRGGPGFATYVPGLQMLLLTSAGYFGYGSAIGLVLALVVLIFTISRFRFSQTPEAG